MAVGPGGLSAGWRGPGLLGFAQRDRRQFARAANALQHGLEPGRKGAVARRGGALGRCGPDGEAEGGQRCHTAAGDQDGNSRFHVCVHVCLHGIDIVEGMG
jgi:hypothetical protein